MRIYHSVSYRNFLHSFSNNHHFQYSQRYFIAILQRVRFCTVLSSYIEILQSQAYSNTVCSVISVDKAFIALSKICRLIAFSSSMLTDGFPKGWGIAIAGTILLAPTVNEIGTTVQICTTGIPVLSISFTIVAPQRVHVPQVDVRITASTPAATKRVPISEA